MAVAVLEQRLGQLFKLVGGNKPVSPRYFFKQVVNLLEEETHIFD